MKQIILAALLALSLFGCATVPEQKVDQPIIVKQKIVLLTIPDEMFEVPPPQPYANSKGMTDKDFANWLIDNEKRQQAIEKKLNAIQKFQELRKKDLAPVLTD